MTLLSDKVKSIPTICGLELAFTGSFTPSAIEGYQQFYNALPVGTDFGPAYFGKATVGFEEESDTGAPGTSYKQKLIIRFPTTDNLRADRLAKMHKVKFIKIKLSDGRDLVMGRNDFEQNARVRIKAKTNEHLAQVEFETVSISPCGYTPSLDANGLPTLFEINFVNP